MKKIQDLLKGLVVCAMAVAMVSTLAAQSENHGVAKVVRVTPPARYSTGNNVWMPLRAGATLMPGTMIETFDKGQVDLALGDGGTPAPSAVVNSGKSYQPSANQNVIRVYQNSVLAIDKLTIMETGAGPVTETQLDLQ